MKALIIGGGLSGLATAVNLLEQGIDVEIIEADEILGGRASSWKDEDGDAIDNGLHVFHPYYINLLAFFKKMGIEKNLIWKQPEFHFAQAGGNQAVLRFKDKSTPLHVVDAVLDFAKSYKDVCKCKMIKAIIPFAGIIMKYKPDMDKLDDCSWGEWCNRYAPKDALKLLDPVAKALNFTEPYALSAKVMGDWVAKVGNSYQYTGQAFANGGLGDIWVGSCLDYIKQKGGTFETKKVVTAIKVEDKKITEVIVNGTEVRTADIYVSAMPPAALRKLLPSSSFNYLYFQDLCYFQNSPSVSIQIWFDKKLTKVDATFYSTDTIFNSFADLSNVLPNNFKDGSMFEMVIAPADGVTHMPDEVIYDKCIKDIKRLFPLAKDSKVKKHKVIRKHQGVYRALPGMEQHRPYQRTPYLNFYLTGDWTKTQDCSGNMEAALQSANSCTELIALDKLKRNFRLNVGFNKPAGLVPLLRIVKPAIIITLVIVGLIILKVLI